ncbi:type II toxin-antitoxin system RelE/ParE family toxin [Psychrosphaera aquimarina]|uniref:Type II toxin-antitoxin system RelE/ParE family toxin n=1 Tax=Psychrosphaera aquimarina TaxID=2044854 RepID=A0ABU3R1V4_9GAMM|nr:type II toxin-antitoxin system RelE/ParE family toxin [Psychrosphaera aquimarina]MDU0113273.1 type II toxin-antitoxin system RelE/ParE family toxin [Psychrosphaera aquimarina]
MAIKSFTHKGLEELYVNGDSPRINNQHHKVLLKYMDAINASHHPKDLKAIYRHKFSIKKGSGDGVYSLEVNGNFRLTFQIEDYGAVFLDYQDYHGKQIRAK